MGDLVDFFFRRRRPKLPPNWQRYRTRRRRVSARDVRIMVWIGLIIGLLAYQALRLWAPSPGGLAPPAIERVADPYAESRRSREILERQEGRPSALPSEGGGLATQAAVRVIDGDTFDYGGVRIRVADIDTPEVRGDCAYERALAARATRRMEALLGAGPFELRPGGDGRDEDRYGRKLRIVMRDGRSLGAVLVAEGLARAWGGYREPWCA